MMMIDFSYIIVSARHRVGSVCFQGFRRDGMVKDSTLFIDK